MRVSTFIFLIILIISLKTSSISLKESLTDSELIDFPVAELEEDCENLQFFKEILENRINFKENNLLRVSAASSSIKDAKILILKIINIEKKLELGENTAFSQKIASNSSKKRSKKAFLQLKGEFYAVIEKLDEIFELLSAEFQRNVEELDDLLQEVENEHSKNIEKCREIIKLFNEIEVFLQEIAQNHKYLLEKLKEKAQDTDLLLIYADC